MKKNLDILFEEVNWIEDREMHYVVYLGLKKTMLYIT